MAEQEYPELRFDLSNQEFEDWWSVEMETTEQRYFAASKMYLQNMLKLIEVEDKGLDKVINFNAEVKQRKAKLFSEIQNVKERYSHRFTAH